MEVSGTEHDELLTAYIRAHRPARIFVQGYKAAYALVAVWEHRLYLVFEGEVAGHHILGVLQEAVKAGLLPDDNFSVLVNMMTFTGALDWAQMAKISDVMPTGTCTTNKNAYVVRDVITASLTKINATRFPRTQHHAFHDETKALAWLGWD